MFDGDLAADGPPGMDLAGRASAVVSGGRYAPLARTTTEPGPRNGPAPGMPCPPCWPGARAGPLSGGAAGVGR